MHGPERRVAGGKPAREFASAKGFARGSAGLENHAIGVTARSAALIRAAARRWRRRLTTASMSGRRHIPDVRTARARQKGLEFKAVGRHRRGAGPGSRKRRRHPGNRGTRDARPQRERCGPVRRCTRTGSPPRLRHGETSPSDRPGKVEKVRPLSPFTRQADPSGLPRMTASTSA